MVPPLGGIRNDSGVVGDLLLRLVERVRMSRDELALVVRAMASGSVLQILPAVTDHNLGRVLVGHNDCGGRQTAAVGQGVVGLEGFLGHAGVEVGTHFEHIPA